MAPSSNWALRPNSAPWSWPPAAAAASWSHQNSYSTYPPPQSVAAAYFFFLTFPLPDSTLLSWFVWRICLLCLRGFSAATTIQIVTISSQRGSSGSSGRAKVGQVVGSAPQVVCLGRPGSCCWRYAFHWRCLGASEMMSAGWSCFGRCESGSL